MAASDWEGALFATCAALEATAVKEVGRNGRRSYKEFVHDNLASITDIAFGARVLNINLRFDHPQMKTSSDGVHSIEEILYVAVRCGLYHEAALPINLRSADKCEISCVNEELVLPASLINRLITAVIAPVNASESAPRSSVLNLGPVPIPVNKLWGRRAELLWPMEVQKEAIGLYSNKLTE
jgi:hypothetical protein